MQKQEAEQAAIRINRCDHAHIFWHDGGEDEFGISRVSVETLEKYVSDYDYLRQLAISWYPEHDIMDIRGISLRR